jgi:hypothetical protein
LFWFKVDICKKNNWENEHVNMHVPLPIT